MSDTQHTPGPWAIDAGPRLYTIRSKGRGICDMRTPQKTGMHIKEIDGNARLIASAPDLLNDLECVLWKLEHFHEFDTPEQNAFIENMPIHLRATIAKATEKP